MVIAIRLVNGHSMKSLGVHLFIIAAVFMTFQLFVISSMAENQTPGNSDTIRPSTSSIQVSTNTPGAEQSHANHPPSTQPGYPARRLIGETVQSTTGEDLGLVKDFVIDMRSGQLLYVVVSSGGF